MSHFRALNEICLSSCTSYCGRCSPMGAGCKSPFGDIYGLLATGKQQGFVPVQLTQPKPKCYVGFSHTVIRKGPIIYYRSRKHGKWVAVLVGVFINFHHLFRRHNPKSAHRYEVSWNKTKKNKKNKRSITPFYYFSFTKLIRSCMKKNWVKYKNENFSCWHPSAIIKWQDPKWIYM